MRPIVLVALIVFYPLFQLEHAPKYVRGVHIERHHRNQHRLLAEHYKDFRWARERCKRNPTEYARLYRESCGAMYVAGIR